MAKEEFIRMNIPPRAPDPKETLLKYGLLAIGGIFILSMLMGMLVNVPPGFVGIMFDRTAGGIQQKVLSEGWAIQLPFIQQIYLMDSRTTKVEFPASAATSDLQEVSSKVAVSYHIKKSAAPKIYQELGGEFADNIIAPAIQENFKANTAKFKAEELIQNREAVKNQVTHALQTTLTKYDIVLDEVSMVDFRFSPEFDAAINAKVVSKQLAEKATNDLVVIQIQAQQKVAEAEGYANSAITAANGSATSTLLQANADAEAIRVKGQAQADVLRAQRQEVTPQLVALRNSEKWDGRLPNIVMGGQALPIMNLNTSE